MDNLSVVSFDKFYLYLGLMLWGSLRLFWFLTWMSWCSWGRITLNLWNVFNPLIRESEIIAILSFMDFEKGLKESKLVYLAGLVEVNLDMYIEVPDIVAKLVEEFKDVIPSKLLKEFPTWMKIDHKIELILGSVSPAHLSYHMSVLELAKLRK